MTAKEMILQLIELRKSYIINYCIYENTFINFPILTKETADYLQQLEKLKGIVENLDSEIESESLKHFTAAFAKEGFIKGAKHIINKLNEQL